jgi:hypothetical protein
VQAEALAEQGRDLAERHAELFVELDRQRNRVRAELDTGRAERLRRLERMSPLHAPMTAPARADMNIEAPPDRFDWRQVFLILRGDVRLGDGLAARRALRRPRAPLRRAFRKRRRLPRAGPTGGFQFRPSAARFSLKSRPLALHPCTVGFGPIQLLAQPHDLLSQLGDRLVRLRLACARHAPVMPEFSRRYNSDAVTRYRQSCYHRSGAGLA